MNFAKTYFNRFHSDTQLIDENPDENLKLIIAIPCFNETEILKSLQSIADCDTPDFPVEVITVVNFSENANQQDKDFNLTTFNKIKDYEKIINTNKLKFHSVLVKDMPPKFAGVGLARKTGMDEALRRFDFRNRPEGIIVGFDADALVDKNYLNEIIHHFAKNPKTNAVSIHYEHPIDGYEFSQEIYERIISYELHLRYYNQALKYTGFPYAHHTVGSAFAVRADIYAKQGGMNRKKAGEDFYFLQKIMPLGNYSEINSTKVIPSPRESDRVPFGTGAAVLKLKNERKISFPTYNFDAFKDLKYLFDNKLNLFQGKAIENLALPIEKFLANNNFKDDLKKIISNSPNEKIFTKRFFDWFNAFRIIRFLNIMHENHYKKTTPEIATFHLLSELNIETSKNKKSAKELLLFLRDFERGKC